MFEKRKLLIFAALASVLIVSSLMAIPTALAYSGPYASSITGYDGPVDNPTYLTGSSNDGNYATIYGYGPYQFYGSVSAAMNTPASGHIFAYGYGSGALYVYTSSDGSNWNPISSVALSGSPGWVDCGVCTSSFSYIGFTAEDPYNIYNVNIDSVVVDSTYYTLTISSSGSGYTSPSGSPQYLIETYATVQATANDDYVFDHWLLDGGNAGNNPTINVFMNSAHTLQAVFVPRPDGYISSVTGSGGPVLNPTYLIGENLDSNYAQIDGYGPYQYYGYVTGVMNAQTSGDITAYGYVSSGSGHLSVYTSLDGYNWNLIATPYVSSGSPGWIYCGTSGTFSYIALVAEDPNNIFSVHIDCVNVN